MENIERVLGYGIPRQIFLDKFNALDPDEKEKLDRIGQRLETIKTLSHEALFMSNPDVKNGSKFSFGRFELPSIQIYLYCTCMDTLAGQPKHKKFSEWITEEKKEALSIVNIAEYYEEYYELYGNNRNFKKLFTNLSPKIKRWLNENVAIQESNEHEVLTERNEDNLIKHLTKYFYTYWRNSFTHQSITRPVDSYGEYYFRVALNSENEWFRQSTDITLDRKSKTKWDLWHKKDLDIGIISRVIIQSVVFQQMDIEITDELIIKNVYLLHRLYWMYQYIHEIRENAHYLDLWMDFEEEHGRQFISDLRSSGIGWLSYEASNKLLEFFGPNNSLREYIQGYINNITDMNTLIDNFNIEHPRLKDFHSQEEEKRCKQDIKDFLSELTKEISYKAIIKHAHEYQRIWIDIRDNHEL